MPILEWIGKERVINHHFTVPYHVLERQYSYDSRGKHTEDNGSENMIIHGDNLLALKSLLPQYEGRINCIYIDPPYNTGNENWVYNDNVNDPRINKWLGEVVGKEGEDLSRHDKWLCMMYPRLKLLHRLLADNGAIFISIDDTEYASLKFVCDEIFGANCFISNISWQRTYSTRNDSKGIVNAVEHILVYSRMPNWSPNRLSRTEDMNARYKNPDNDSNGLWRADNPSAPGASRAQSMVHAIQHPFTGEMLYPPNGASWRFPQGKVFEIMRGWGEYELRDLHDAKERARVCNIPESEVRQDVKGVVLSCTLEEARKKAQEIYDRGNWPIFYFTNKGQGGIGRKTYLKDVGGPPPVNLWLHTETGHTDEAKKEILSVLGSAVFDTPKPTRLIERVLQIATDKNALVLDSFAGSGTTAHAVLNMNRRDGGNRKFILIETEDYANRITAERVKKIIDGYKKDQEYVIFDEEITLDNLDTGSELLAQAQKAYESAKDKYSTVKKPKIENGHLRVIATQKAIQQKNGTNEDFSYYELGAPLMENENLNEDIELEKIREYVYFTETKHKASPKSEEEPYLLGICFCTAYYFYYEKDNITELNRDFLHSIKAQAERYVIYADLCTLSEEECNKFNITFKKIPRDIQKI